MVNFPSRIAISIRQYTSFVFTLLKRFDIFGFLTSARELGVGHVIHPLTISGSHTFDDVELFALADDDDRATSVEGGGARWALGDFAAGLDHAENDYAVILAELAVTQG